MNDVVLQMKHDEALVLFNWLATLEEKLHSVICDQAEQTVLWKIEGQLESSLPDVLLGDYKERIAAAKSRLLM